MDTIIKMKHMISKKMATIKKSALFCLCVVGMTHMPIVHADTVPLDEVIAVAEHDAIMRSDLDRRLAQVRGQFAARNAPIPPDDVLTKQVLDVLILESLQIQLADRAGIRVDDDTLNQQMAKIASQNNMTLTQFSQALTQEGTTYPAAREQIRREMAISQLRQRQVGQRIRISDQEVDRALNSKGKKDTTEYRLANIVIRPSANTPEAIKQAQKTANEVYDQAKAGRSFAQLAAAHSAAPNAKSGGDLGWRKASQLPPNVNQAISSMGDAGITPPFQDEQGISIIKVIEKRAAVDDASPAQVTEVHARHILISPSKIRSDAQSQKLITQIKEQIDQGADFAKLAKKYSDDASSASAGGDLGWSSSKKFVPEFTSEVDSLPINKVSAPFKTKFGWHIVEVLERKNQDNAANQEKESARLSIRKQKYEDELQMWLRQIRQEAFVDIKLK
jgi:peptidyl-prolyl cis-trans isomerase SurA